MKLSKLFKGVTILQDKISDIEISGIAYNSRKVLPGYLFICIKGYKTDGHLYIENAVKNGAVAILVQDEPTVDFGVKCYHTDNTRRALAEISANFYDHPASKLKMVGVTGTNGKTTTTTLIKGVLDYCGYKCGLIGTNGNFICNKEIETERTTPESLELQELLDKMVSAGVQYVIMEVSSHSLELMRVHGIKFDIAAFTNLTQDHLDFHPDMQSYFLAKCKLFENTEFGIINIDDSRIKSLLNNPPCEMMTCSALSTADCFAENIRLSARGVIFDVNLYGEVHQLRLGIPGRFSVYNALAAFCVCVKLGIPIDTISDALLIAPGVKGRIEALYTRTDYTILIDYAHTPDGLKNIIKTAKEFTPNRVITLFGCGGDRDSTKRNIMGKIAGELSDFCIITSDNPRTEEPMSIIKKIEEGMKQTSCEYVIIENRKEAISFAIKNAKAGDCIILAGKGHETYQIIGTQKRDFDERDIVKEILDEQNAK